MAEDFSIFTIKGLQILVIFDFRQKTRKVHCNNPFISKFLLVCFSRYEYAAVQSVDLCRCHGNKDDLRLLSNGLCLDK